MPTWKTPQNIARVLAAGDGTWEDERYAPILLTAMSGIEFEGREIPVSWQIEFDPCEEEFEAANAKLEDAGLEPDGYGWGESIQQAIRQRNPELAQRLHATDCENATCVIWVESEADCRELLQTVWKLVFAESE